MARVLLAEPDLNLTCLLKAQLQSDGHEVVQHSGGDGLTEVVLAARPALVVLRLVSESKARHNMAEQLRQRFHERFLPIIALQSKPHGQPKYHAYHYDVDDVLTEPFDARELSLRVSAVLRRADDAARPEVPVPAAVDHVIHAGAVTLLPSALTLRIHKEQFMLTRTEMKIMLCLAEMCGQACDHVWLQSRVWNFNSQFGSQHVQWHVNHLRKKLGRHGRCIVTLPRVGYMLDPKAV